MSLGGTVSPRHIVLLTRHFPPDSAVGAIRPYTLAMSMLARGHRVTVVTAQIAGAVRTREAGLTIIEVPVVSNPRQRIARLKKPLLGTQKLGGGFSATAPALTSGESTFDTMTRWALSLLWLPDDQQGFIPPAVSTTLALVRQTTVDLIYSTAPPHSATLAGLLVSWIGGLPWIAEFRDPWEPARKPPAHRSAFSDAVEVLLRRSTLRRSKRIVAVTSQVAMALDAERVASGKPADTLVSFNGIPPLDHTPGERAGPLTVLHAGELYLGRDPRPFLRATALAVQQLKLSPEQLRLVFMGAGGESFRGVTVEAMARELSIEEFVQVEGHLPLDACRRRMTEADALLLLAQDQPAQIPNKLYDYLAARRPIIAYADAEGESAAILRRVGGHTIIPDNAPEHADRVVQALLAARNTPSGAGMDEAVLDELRTEVQLEKVVRAIEEVALGAHHG